jgi:predicted nucleotidyltransferase
MDKDSILEIAKNYTDAIKIKMPFEKALLFGSFINGVPTESSDIDIAIIFKDFDNLIEKQVELMRIRRKIDSRIEPHPIRLADYNVNNALASEVLNYGVEI